MPELLENKNIIISSLAGLGAGIATAYLFNKINNVLNTDKKNLYINLHDIKHPDLQLDKSYSYEEHYDMEDYPKNKKKSKI